MADELLQVQVIMQDLKRVTERVVTGITLDVTANLQEDPNATNTGTPVDTGWARGNWVPSIGAPVDDPEGTPDNVGSARAASESGKAQVAGYRLEQGRVFVSNNVPYINILNEGHSSQQEAMFVQRAIEKAVTVDIRGLAG